MTTRAPALMLTASILACWRLSHLVSQEDGPFDAVLRVRARAGSSTWGRLMDCPFCVSVWVAAPLAGWTVRRSGLPAGDVLPMWLAISGGASLLERATACGDRLPDVVALAETEGGD